VHCSIHLLRCSVRRERAIAGGGDLVKSNPAALKQAAAVSAAISSSQSKLRHSEIPQRPATTAASVSDGAAR